MSNNGRWIALAALGLLVYVGLSAVQAAAEEGESDDETASVEREEDAEPSPPVEGEADDDAETEEEEETYTEEQLREGREAFMGVYEVLMSPRCMNCHPSGNRPLQTDESRPHAMNISRESVDAGLECATCHREQNSEQLGIESGPPGAPHWGLPPEDTPMIFEGRTPQQLCEQLQDPERNGGKDLEAILEHVSHDPLVLWGWEPGGDRTTPPLSHEEFVGEATTWVEFGGPCPE